MILYYVTPYSNHTIPYQTILYTNYLEKWKLTRAARPSSPPRGPGVAPPAEHPGVQALVDVPGSWVPQLPSYICNLLRPLTKVLFLLVPCGYIIIKIKGIPKEMTTILPLIGLN